MWACRWGSAVLFWCAVTLAGRRSPSSHICEWATWFVWDRGRGGGRGREKGGGPRDHVMSDPETEREKERERHLYYVMAAGALHPLLSISLFLSLPDSPTQCFTCLCFTAVGVSKDFCYWHITEQLFMCHVLEVLACSLGWHQGFTLSFFPPLLHCPLHHHPLSAFHLRSHYPSLYLPLTTVHLQLSTDSSLSGLASLIWCSPSLLSHHLKKPGGHSAACN